jgi:hypothetical protein
MPLSNPIPPGLRPADWLRRNALVIVLSAGCLVMGLLSFEQNRTISTQRDLIRSLFRDSIELNALKLQREQAAHRR